MTPGTPFGQQLTVRAQAGGDRQALVVVGAGGRETRLSWRELETRANQWARHLASVSAGCGSHVALSIPNSVELVLAALGCWKVGAVPIPMRWDLPDWERTRLLEVIAPAVVLSEANLAGHAQSAAARSGDPVPAVTAPAMSGICSSGSTGLPKVILNARPALWTQDLAQPFMSHWRAVPQPQTILVPGPMYHTNGFNPLQYLLGGDHLIVLEKFDAGNCSRRHRAVTGSRTSPRHRRCWPASPTLPGSATATSSSIDWILQGAAVMPPGLLRHLVRSARRRAHRDGLRHDGEPRAHRAARRRVAAHPGSVGRGFRDTEIRIVDADGNELPAGELGEIYLRAR